MLGNCGVARPSSTATFRLADANYVLSSKYSTHKNVQNFFFLSGQTKQTGVRAEQDIAVQFYDISTGIHTCNICQACAVAQGVVAAGWQISNLAQPCSHSIHYSFQTDEYTPTCTCTSRLDGFLEVITASAKIRFRLHRNVILQRMSPFVKSCE